MKDDRDIVYESERGCKRFCVIKDKWVHGDYFLNVYDREDYMVVGYYDVDDLSTARDVCDYCNRLADEIKSDNEMLNTYKSLVASDKIALHTRIDNLEKELNNVINRNSVELRYYREVLEDCLESYPGDKGLLDFKNTMGW